jgi:hypothetical protein
MLSDQPSNLTVSQALGAGTPPPHSTDLAMPPEVASELESLPPSPSTPPSRLSIPPPDLLIDPLLPPPSKPIPVEVGLLKLATAAGSLQDVHQILSQYILAQSPDPTTGQIKLTLFHSSIVEAITKNYSTILSYLFYMRVGEPYSSIYLALQGRSSAIFEVFLNHGWNINEPIQRTQPPALG